MTFSSGGYKYWGQIIANRNYASLQYQRTSGDPDNELSIQKIGYLNLTSGAVLQSSASSISSDDRIKSYEVDIEDATEMLSRITPKKYKKHPQLLLDEADETPDLTGVDWKWEYGFIAQELEADETLSHFVTRHPDDDLRCVNYEEFVPVLVKAVQELSARISALEAA